MAAAISIRIIRCTFTWLVGNDASAPATNSSESPGRNGVTTNPVSQKIITNRIA